MKGYLTIKQEFLFRDSIQGEIPDSIRAVSAKNGKIGIQLLLSGERSVQLNLEDSSFNVEFYQMLEIPVEYNTGNGINQGGAMVIRADDCPEYAVRKAPFKVYDCLKPAMNGTIGLDSGLAAAYICISPKEGVKAGTYVLPLQINVDGEKKICKIEYVVYPVVIHENDFQQTNWFDLKSMATMHKIEVGTDAFYDMVRSYARAMRRTHQRVFCIWINEDFFKEKVKPPYRFHFDVLKPIIEIFFEEGFDTLETGGILSRGYLPDGSRDMYTRDFKCAANPDISADSDEGYALLSAELCAFSHFLRENHWDQKILFHVIDEPDVHYRTEDDLQARRTQYFMSSNLVRRYFPNAKTIEAVKTTKFHGAIDIMVPITDGYQNHKEAFDRAIALGDEIWTYVCCGPEGHWLNRFLDQPLVNGRLLFWGCAANRISGYLHWGFNQFGCTPNPFHETRGINDCGIGTDFPCGDAFIVYPGADGPWLSMRLEAERRGAEEACLLSNLRALSPERCDELIHTVFHAFDDYDNDPQKVEEAYENLLKALSQDSVE